MYTLLYPDFFKSNQFDMSPYDSINYSKKLLIYFVLSTEYLFDSYDCVTSCWLGIKKCLLISSRNDQESKISI